MIAPAIRADVRNWSVKAINRRQNLDETEVNTRRASLCEFLSVNLPSGSGATDRAKNAMALTTPLVYWSIYIKTLSKSDPSSWCNSGRCKVNSMDYSPKC